MALQNLDSILLPYVNLPPKAIAALRQIETTQNLIAPLIAKADETIRMTPMPVSGTPPAQGIAAILALKDALLQEGQLIVLNAKLARIAFNMQAAG